MEGHVNIQPVIKEAGIEMAMIFGSGWHTDSAFLPNPPAISMLYGVDILRPPGVQRPRRLPPRALPHHRRRRDPGMTHRPHVNVP